ncbi:aspartate 1-decarboxylase [Candidatus Aerophobetes bacterium]|nr:aspartate 1-decarboxylase [Candidatus Aerophobetes bacterium]
MFRVMCRAKIHNAKVTETKLEYEGSITIDENLLKEVDILPGEKVEVFNLNNGARFDTYVIEGKPGSGIICVNGAAARLAQVGDRLIIVAYSMVPEAEVRYFEKKCIAVSRDNKIAKKLE